MGLFTAYYIRSFSRVNENLRYCEKCIVYNQNMTMMRIAVAGGIAAGKSTVVNHLRSLGVFVIDYDVLARK